MYYTSSFYQGFTYEQSLWQLLGPEGEVILIINLFLFFLQQEYRLFKRNLCTLSLNFCSFGFAVYFFFRHNWYCEQGSILSYTLCNFNQTLICFLALASIDEGDQQVERQGQMHGGTEVGRWLGRGRQVGTLKIPRGKTVYCSMFSHNYNDMIFVIEHIKILISLETPQ